MSQSRKIVLADFKRKFGHQDLWKTDAFFNFVESLDQLHAPDPFETADDHLNNLNTEFECIRAFDSGILLDEIIVEQLNYFKQWRISKKKPITGPGFTVNFVKSFLRDPINLTNWLTNRVNYGGVKRKELAHDLMLMRWLVWELLRK